jgi:hypothetical protein
MKLKKVLPAYIVLFSISFISQASSPATGHEKHLQAFLKKAAEIGKDLDNRDNTLLDKLNRSEALFEKYNEDPAAKDIIAQFSSTLFSFASEHQRALSIADIGHSQEKAKKSSLDLSVFSSRPAVSAILSVAENQKVVMVNEAHHIAQHRALTYDLLEGLWERGFRYLALEALSSSEANPFRGPLKNDSGYYTQEPMFAYMVFHALEIGYRLIPYDSGGADIPTREMEAARNLKRSIFDKDPDAKVLIHVGYSHIDETEWLARKLNDLMGIDPLTIDQVKFSEKSAPEFEHQDYENVLSNFTSKEPLVLLDKQNQLYSSEPNKWDVTVVSPRTSYTINKPAWMIKDRKTFSLNPSLCKGKYPCLVEVFDQSYARKEDLLNFTPYDKTVIYSELDKKVVLIRQGITLVVVTDENRVVLSQTQVSQ